MQKLKSGNLHIAIAFFFFSIISYSISENMNDIWGFPDILRGNRM